ncbi:uncharacterized protein BJ171DRAFT_498448 [Polychytrium aggregatum]|uniref:uncharacterized protein n=1 Tax=Polychytrium aggregatum TaxID=110093 RepID=UPI0022FF00B6|nr:uncharacterized protein BJ171DRAFT_498448 [Polychytrium aggregatum]KAI9206033.1 hypothetical protein BJ171DRAFT_498448 [Polychytrium aggregatum]
MERSSGSGSPEPHSEYDHKQGSEDLSSSAPTPGQVAFQTALARQVQVVAQRERQLQENLRHRDGSSDTADGNRHPEGDDGRPASESRQHQEHAADDGASSEGHGDEAQERSKDLQHGRSPEPGSGPEHGHSHQQGSSSAPSAIDEEALKALGQNFSASAATSGLLVLSTTALANGKQSLPIPPGINNPFAAFYYSHALASAAPGLDPFTFMARNHLANSFPLSLIQEAAMAAAQGQATDETLERQSDEGSETHPGSPDHNAKEFKHFCPTCNRAFSRAYNLKSHIRTHHDHRPYVCHVCQLRFTRNHDLSRHLRTHSKEKSHSCEQCGRMFARRDALRRHELMNPEGKKIHCVSPITVDAHLDQTSAVVMDDAMADPIAQVAQLSAAQASQLQAHVALQVQAQLQAQMAAAAQSGATPAEVSAAVTAAFQNAQSQLVASGIVGTSTEEHHDHDHSSMGETRINEAL